MALRLARALRAAARHGPRRARRHPPDVLHDDAARGRRAQERARQLRGARRLQVRRHLGGRRVAPLGALQRLLHRPALRRQEHLPLRHPGGKGLARGAHLHRRPRGRPREAGPRVQVDGRLLGLLIRPILPDAALPHVAAALRRLRRLEALRLRRPASLPVRLRARRHLPRTSAHRPVAQVCRPTHPARPLFPSHVCITPHTLAPRAPGTSTRRTPSLWTPTASPRS